MKIIALIERDDGAEMPEGILDYAHIYLDFRSPKNSQMTIGGKDLAGWRVELGGGIRIDVHREMIAELELEEFYVPQLGDADLMREAAHQLRQKDK